MWTVETLNAIVDAEIEALPADLRARLVRMTLLIEAVGLDGLPRDSVKHLDGKLWEIRVTAASGIFARHICHSQRPTRGDRQGVRQEVAEDSKT